MHVDASHGGTTSWRGTLAAGAIVAGAAIVFLLVHGFVTGWNFTTENWDAGYYFRIAASGYGTTRGNIQAFLPGYPVLLAPGARLLPQAPFLASFITSSMLSILAGGVLYRVLRERLDTATALIGIALLAFSPFSIYFYNGYSEAAFILAASLTLLWLAERHLLLAAVATGYALICRPYALALLPLFLPGAWLLLGKRDFWTLGRMVFLGALPSLLYFGYMQHVYGDPFIGAKVLTHWEQYEPISQAWPLPVRTMYGFYFSFQNAAPGTWMLSLGMYFFSVITVLAACSRLPWRLAAYSLLLLACVYATDALVPINLGRHALLAFAFAPALAILLGNGHSESRCAAITRHAASGIALAFFASMFVVTSMRFCQGLWVS
jgi:hypothetical protein